MKLDDRKMEENTYMSFDSLDIDTVPLPSLPSRNSSDLYEWTKNDEILLDSEDRPLDLAVNANAPVTFNLVTGSDRTAEVLRSLHAGSFTPSQRRKLMEKFNIDDDMMSSSDFGDTRTSQSSASESTGKPDSLEGSPIPNDERRNRFRSSFSHVKTHLKNKESSPKVQSDFKNLEHLRNEREKSKKSEKLTEILSISTLPRVQNGKRETKQVKRPQNLSQRQGRDRGVSASARKIFSSLRRNARGRSASKERREKQNHEKSSPQPTSPPDDLSSDVHLPGILKIFGDAVSPGAKYKSVLATRQSKARELVKAALERYGVRRNMGKNYVLCEVVGRMRVEKIPVNIDTKTSRPGYSVQLSSQQTECKTEILDEAFVEDYVRPLNDHEKPLILQSFWKPLEGYVRRFELRERSQVSNQIMTEKDTETKDVNAQAKRIILKNARLSRTQSSLNVQLHLPEPSSSEEDEEEGDSSICKKKLNKEENNNDLEHTTPPTPEQFADHHDVTTNGETGNNTPVPFLLTLQGDDGVSNSSENDRGRSLVHHLDTKVTVIGRSNVDAMPRGESSPAASNEINIKLSGQDIKPHHCVVYRVKREEHEESNSSNSPWKVTLHLVADDCDVAVNGQTVVSDREICNGDIVSIGSNYMFMLKDPTSRTNLNTNMRLTGQSSNVNRLNSIASKGSAFTPVKKRWVEMEITYRPEYEDHVLDVIFAAANDIISSTSSKVISENCDRELAPARFLIHCIEQSCFNYTFEQKKGLLFVIATNLQTILLDATGSVSMQDDTKIKNPEEGINYILPKLEDVVFWMSNSLEIFSYLQTDLIDRVQARVAKEVELNEVDPNILNDASSFRVTDDVLAVLEEIVMYAFQQLVYYLTKTLYGALPKVLDTNPFSEVNEDSEEVVRGTGHVIAIYDAALGLTRKYGVHPAIESQLFAYLFFFTNVSLFNTLMEDEAGPKYYRWDKGVQIRGNLEEIECWANDNGFQDQATKFIEKFSALTNLLATTKTQMMQSTWSHFRRDFPQLHPIQLRQILDGYVLGPRVKKRPVEWLPDSEDLEDSTEEDYLVESYDNHPPLVLPADGTQIDLDNAPTADWHTALKDVVMAVGQGREVETASVHGVWRSNINHNNSEFGERQQPDGREIPFGQQRYIHSPVSSSSTSSTQVNSRQRKSLTKSDIIDSLKQSARLHSPSSTSVSSMLSDTTSQASMPVEYKTAAGQHHKRQNGYVPYDYAVNLEHETPKPVPRKTLIPSSAPRNPKSNAISETPRSDASTKYATLDRPRKKNRLKPPKVMTDDQGVNYDSLVPSDHVPHLQGTSKKTTENSTPSNAGPLEDYFVDVTDMSQISGGDAIGDMLVLPVYTTVTKRCEIETHADRHKRASPSSSEQSNESSRAMPNEVFIVDIVKGRKGLGLGLVDGMHTSLQIPGVFVRSLVPDGPSVKRVRMKHQEVIKCWLQEGRLLLGDRILAVNGTSLVSMNYTSAMEELRQAGDRMRFLVGRSGPNVAVKITSSSC